MELTLKEFWNLCRWLGRLQPMANTMYTWQEVYDQVRNDVEETGRGFVWVLNDNRAWRINARRIEGPSDRGIWTIRYQAHTSVLLRNSKQVPHSDMIVVTKDPEKAIEKKSKGRRIWLGDVCRQP